MAAAVIVVAATDLAFAGDADPPRTRDVLATPTVDTESADESALRYLVGRGMSPEKARRRMANQHAALRAVTELRTRAPSGVGAVWLDEDGNLRVRVLDDAGAREARAVGATPVFGTFTTADAQAARDTLVEDAFRNPPAGLSGAVFEIDETANKVIARYLFEGSGVVPQAATELGDLVTASVEVATLRLQADVDVAGATMWNSEDDICTAGWAVFLQDPDGGVPENGVMTAGHCFIPGSDPGQTKFSIDTLDGDTSATGRLSVFDERGDYGVLELDNGDSGGPVMFNGRQVVEAVRNPVVGAIVCKTGATSNQTCGEIQRVDVSTLPSLGEGVPRVLLRGMVRASFCSEPGDSGAPVFTELSEGLSHYPVAAIGILSHGQIYPGPQGGYVCGEKVGKPNSSYFTPLLSMDAEGQFFMKISGG